MLLLLLFYRADEGEAAVAPTVILSGSITAYADKGKINVAY